MDIDAPATSLSQRSLTIVVDGRSHALPADRVTEVIRRPIVTRVPHGPPALLGVFNLRGAVLPLVSLARLIGASDGLGQRVVVLDHGGPVGLLVDGAPRISTDQGGAVHQLDLGTLFYEGFRRKAEAPSTTRAGEDQPEISAPPVDQRVLVSFLVGEQLFAMPLSAVREALRLPQEITRVASTDQIVLGLINLRNKSLPLLSLAALLGFPLTQPDAAGGAVLIVDHDGSQVGLVVSAISSVLRLDEIAIDKVPSVLLRGQGDAELDAIGRLGVRSLVSILSVPKIFVNSSVTSAVASRPRQDEEDQADRKEKVMDLDADASEAMEQYLIFDLGDERYGIPIAVVDEVLRLPDVVTRLPKAPRFVTGIINLRGRPLPLIDQRQRFGVAAERQAVRPRVVVVTVGSVQAGFVVDGATEIVSLGSDRVAVAPSLASDRSALFNRVANVGDSDRSLVLIVDPQELLSRAEQDVIAELARPQKSNGAR